ncbi:MAG: Hpt domain-containing protein [Oscillatoriales cyanobacterium SM2_1_8]|nr:Hpt domain-containing protein [Oscillatoriales cyanobacterium SM2_1_8]
MAIDLEYLGQLSDGDREFEAELLSVYLEDTATHLAALQDAVANSQTEHIEREAHHIKGASGNVGALGMHILASELETLGKQKTAAGADRLLLKLNAEFEAVRSFIYAYIA